MARCLYSFNLTSQDLNLSFSNSADYEEFKELAFNYFCTDKTGSWPFVIGTITYGVDLPAWWEEYDRQRDKYNTLLGDELPLRSLCLSEKEKQAEKWRRYDICARNGLATCEEVHYPCFFEIDEVVCPQRLDAARSIFPSGVFGQYIMACPPSGRLIDLDNPFILDQVWVDHKDFFIDSGLLVKGGRIPSDVAVSVASNQSLREIIKRHGQKPHSTRAMNERLLLTLCSDAPDLIDEISELPVLKNSWCRMPPKGLSWEQIQSYRWLSRGMGGAIFDLFVRGMYCSHSNELKIYERKSKSVVD